MKLNKLLILPFGLMLSVVGCASKPFSTYHMATTSFVYDPTYSEYDLQLNGIGIGGGFGNAISTDPIKVGVQEITWGESNSKKKHSAQNQVVISRAQLKGKRYLAAHIYPDDTVEIMTSNDRPQPTEKGLHWMGEIRQQQKAKH